MERTSFIQGTTPVLIVSPHGYDDENTDVLAERIAKDFGAFAVINRGWRRSSKVDQLNDFANCNDIRHLHEEVVREEFLNPILRSVAKIKTKYGKKVYVVVLHGCKDQVRTKADDEMLDVIVGYGAGNPSSYSCRIKTKNLMIHCLQEEGFGVYEGAPGGQYAGRAKNNLNQFFTRWMPDQNIESMQLEIVKEMRSDEEMVELTSEGLVTALDAFMLDIDKEFDREIKVGQI